MEKKDKINDDGIPMQIKKSPLEILQDEVSIYFQDFKTEQDVVDYVKKIREKLYCNEPWYKNAKVKNEKGFLVDEPFQKHADDAD